MRSRVGDSVVWGSVFGDFDGDLFGGDDGGGDFGGAFRMGKPPEVVIGTDFHGSADHQYGCVDDHDSG